MLSLYLSGNKNFWVIFLVIFLRYLILASIAFLIFYVIRRKTFLFKKIQPKLPFNKDYAREIIFSVITALIFAAIGYIVFVTPVSKYTQTYWNFGEHSVGYFLFSIVIMLLVHDTYFYWTHAIGIFLLIMMMYNVYGHLGYELYPKGFSSGRLGKWINTSVNHNMHHQTIQGNYGLYFLWWDRWMGTLNSSYNETFEAVKSRTSIDKLVGDKK
jgi:Delta7-sterol 5-desaturase